jgi:hypothetical protein
VIYSPLSPFPFDYCDGYVLFTCFPESTETLDLRIGAYLADLITPTQLPLDDRLLMSLIKCITLTFSNGLHMFLII